MPIPTHRSAISKKTPKYGHGKISPLIPGDFGPPGTAIPVKVEVDLRTPQGSVVVSVGPHSHDIMQHFKGSAVFAQGKGGAGDRVVEPGLKDREWHVYVMQLAGGPTLAPCGALFTHP